ncbi:MAG: hypothetical protein ACO2OX_00825 [Candidatus Nanopusillus sp.]
MLKVIKRSDEEEEFLGDKVYNSLINAGASEEVAKQIVKELKDWIKTEKFGKYILMRLEDLYLID